MFLFLHAFSKCVAEALLNQIVVCAVGYIYLCFLCLQVLFQCARYFFKQVHVVELIHVFSIFASFLNLELL